MAAAPVVVQATPAVVPVAAQPVVVGDLELENESVPISPVSNCHCCSIALAGIGIGSLVLFFFLALVYILTDATVRLFCSFLQACTFVHFWLVGPVGR